MIKVKIRGYTNYSITDTGIVISDKTGKNRKPRSNGLGYLQVDLYKDGIGTNRYLHKLVAEHFIGALESDEINHKDGNKSNCNKSNLEIVTHRENIKHAEKYKLIKRDSTGKFTKHKPE